MAGMERVNAKRVVRVKMRLVFEENIFRGLGMMGFSDVVVGGFL